MRKYYLVLLIFILSACLFGPRQAGPTETAPVIVLTATEASSVSEPIQTSIPFNFPIIPTQPVAPPSGAFSTPSVTPPPINPAYPLLTVRLQAIQLSDDNGGRATRITSQQVKQWVDKANEIFAKASVRILYDPASDFTMLNSTLLNDMTGDTDTNWKREVDFGNRIAAQHAGKMVVFFIHGPGQAATGGGFSFSNYNFVEMPGFNDTAVCGYQNIGILAHEVGHYFGLSHPFAMTFQSLQAAETYLSAHGNDPQAFDGDGLSDTPPDPFIAIPQYQCNPQESITLNGRVFPLPRYNIMSYYSTTGIDRTDLTPQQSVIVRWVLSARTKMGMATPTNINVPGAIEFATLPVKNKVNLSPSVQDMTPFSDTPRWSGNRQLFASAQPGSTIGFSISVAASGKYRFNLYATMAPDFGKIQTLVDGNPLGAPLDLYAPLVMPSGSISVGTVGLTAGSHTLGFRLTGKDPASSNYLFGLNSFTLTQGG